MLTLRLLGTVELGCDGRVLPLTVRKAAALLLLLGLARDWPRSRLVAWLWPELDETSGRRNLRRELARLRELLPDPAANGLLVADGDRLALAADVQVDVHEFEALLKAGQLQAALAHWRGPLADGLDLPGNPELADWLAAQRNLWQSQRQRALSQQAVATEAQGDVQASIQLVQTLLADDPLQEHQHRQLMRLLASVGRREAALAQYARCCALLRDELGLRPMAETDALAEAIRGLVPAAANATTVATSPSGCMPGDTPDKRPGGPAWAAVLPFVGRVAERTRLVQAWQQGACVWIEGEAGVGKSRLAQEVAADQGAIAIALARPGDRERPYAAFARALQCLAGPQPDAALLADAGLARWVVDELARLWPDLGPPGPAVRTAEDRARLHEACAQAWQALAADSFDAVILDDWHLADDASLAVLVHVVQRRREKALPGPREWLLSRPLPAGERRHRLAEGLQALSLRLQPLAEHEVLGLVQRLSGAAHPVRFTARLQRATGGNPFFIAEALRLLAELGALNQDADGRWSTPVDAATEDYRELPLPDTVRDTVLARVLRLPQAAQRLLEVACLAPEPLVADWLAAASALSALEATGAMEQLLEAGLWRELDRGGFGFSHDLARQALEAALAPQRRRLVQRRLALAAQDIGAPAALVARHFQAADEPLRAAQHWRRAGDEALALYDTALALSLWQQALDSAGPAPTAQRAALLASCTQALIDLGDAEGALARRAELAALGPQLTAAARALAELAGAELDTRLDHNADALRRVEALLAAGTLGPETTRALRVKGQALQNLGRLDEAWQGAEQALHSAGGDAALRASLLDTLVMIDYLRGRPVPALALARQALALWQAGGDRRGQAKGWFRVGTLLLVSGDAAQGALALERARTLAAELHLVEQQRDVLVNLMKIHADAGDGAAMLALAEQGWALSPGFPRPRTRQLFLQARLHARCLLGQLGDALVLAEQVLAESEASGEPGARQYAVMAVLDLLSHLGDFERARRLLAQLADADVRQLNYLGVKLSLQQAFVESRAGDAAAARRALDGIAEPQALQQPQDRLDLALREADILLAEGQLAQPMGLLRPLLAETGAPEQDAEAAAQLQPAQRAVGWTLLLRAAHAAGVLDRPEWQRAAALQDAGPLPPLEALDLWQALLATAPPDVPAASVAALAKRASALLDKLVASLSGWPRQQQHLRQRA